ncbi:MAG: transglutaminase family protein [Deltaproteobacteria bacterium]|jgi:transglutaminase-like putative cysteine protease|nr:transglutaminase family protein [Deltaproteobacteria bacterium]
MEKYLGPTYYIESEHPAIISFANQNIKKGQTDLEKAVSLYYAVRDGIRYNPYSIEPVKESMKASSVLKKGDGYCVAKAVLLAACARNQKIPARLGFADVQNHLNTEKLKELMGSDTFFYHGFTELFLNNQWVKATPAFNLELCNNFNVKPLEFDGTKDSVFHPFDKSGNRHMEYIKDHGSFADLPWETILGSMKKAYPKYFENIERRSKNFLTEALKENQ